MPWESRATALGPTHKYGPSTSVKSSRALAEREGYTVVKTYEDRAISGASTVPLPSLLCLDPNLLAGPLRPFGKLALAAG
jgi:hypothetical protein